MTNRIFRLDISKARWRLYQTWARLPGKVIPQPEAIWLGEGRVRIGQRTIKLEPPLAAALEALIKRRAATKAELTVDSKLVDPGRELRRLVKKHPDLAPHITLPGRKGKGGYSTTISVET